MCVCVRVCVWVSLRRVRLCTVVAGDVCAVLWPVPVAATGTAYRYRVLRPRARAAVCGIRRFGQPFGHRPVVPSCPPHLATLFQLLCAPTNVEWEWPIVLLLCVAWCAVHRDGRRRHATCQWCHCDRNGRPRRPDTIRWLHCYSGDGHAVSGGHWHWAPRAATAPTYRYQRPFRRVAPAGGQPNARPFFRFFWWPLRMVRAKRVHARHAATAARQHSLRTAAQAAAYLYASPHIFVAWGCVGIRSANVCRDAEIPAHQRVRCGPQTADHCVQATPLRSRRACRTQLPVNIRS